MRVFEFDSYKDFVAARIKAMPASGRGQYRKIAQHLRMHTSMVSQIFRGNKDLSLEQASHLCEFLGLNELETDYFLVLVEIERAGTTRLKKILLRRLEKLRAQGKQLGSRLPQTQALSDEHRAVFYSSWFYSAIRLLTSIPCYHDIDSIAERLHLPKHIISYAIEFLLSTGLCVEKQGRIEIGPKRTHIPSDSPFVSRHHANWREKAIEHLPAVSDEELAFTFPMSLSKKDVPLIRELVAEMIEKVNKIVGPSHPEKIFCLNIDWFELR